MSELDYEQRKDAGIQELCDLAQHMEQNEAEEFFQAVAYTASERFRSINAERAAFRAQSQSAPRREGVR